MLTEYVLQPHAHLLGDRHEQVVEDLQQHRVDGGADRGAALPRGDARQHQVIERRDRGAPAGLDQRRGIALGDDRRPVDLIARARVLADVKRRVVPAAVEVGSDRPRRPQRSRARRRRRRRLVAGIAGADRLDRHRLDDQPPLGHQEREAAAIRGLERGPHPFGIAKLDDQRGVGAFVLQVGAGNPPQPAGGHALASEFGRRGLAESLDGRARLGHRRLRQRLLDGRLAHRRLVRQPHAVGRQHAGQRVREDARHRQLIGHGAGVLPAGAAEHRQRVFRHVVAALHRDLLDGLGHVAHGDVEEAGGDRLRRLARAGRRRDPVGERREARGDDLAIERLVAVRAEDVREELRLDAAEHDVGVGHRQRAAAAVAGRAGVGAGRVRPDAKPRPVEVQDRAAAGGDGVDAHHRRPHAHAGHQGVELAFVLAGEVRDVGRRAAHVETDDAVEAGHAAGAHHADDAAGRPRQDGVLALEAVRVGQAAAGLHEQQPRVRQFGGHPCHVAAQDRRQVGIDDRRVAARHQLHHRAGLVRHRHLREAGGAGERGGARLVLRVAVAVHHHHGAGAMAGGEGVAQLRREPILVERHDDLPGSADALVGLDHARIQQFRQHDPAVEQARPVLVGDAQRIAEAARDHQHGRLALALQQGIGRHCRPHLDGVDRRDRQRRALGNAEQPADAGDGGIVVLLRVLRQQLERDEQTVRAAGDDVGEGAAAVDPELPRSCRAVRGSHGVSVWVSGLQQYARSMAMRLTADPAHRPGGASSLSARNAPIPAESSRDACPWLRPWTAKDRPAGRRPEAAHRRTGSALRGRVIAVAAAPQRSAATSAGTGGSRYSAHARHPT